MLAGLLGAVERLDAETVLGVARLGRYSVVGLQAREDIDVLGGVTVDSVALVSLHESLPTPPQVPTLKLCSSFRVAYKSSKGLTSP